MLKKLQAEVQPTFICSAGDFYGGVDIYNEPKDHFIARIMGSLHYDAIAVGEKDLAFGLESLLSDWKKYHLNMLCANIYWKSKGKQRHSHGRGPKRVFPAYRVVSRGGLKIGFVAAVSPSTKLKPSKQSAKKRVEALTYVMEDPFPIIKKLIPKVRKKCDVLVLLAHMERDELEKMLPELSGVDIAILGHSPKQEFTKEPYMIGTVPVYMATFQGQVIGDLKVTLNPRKKIEDTRNNVFVLDKTFPDDKEIAQEVAEFEKENLKRQKELYARQQLRGAADQGAGRDIYLGTGSCMRCHLEDFTKYTKTKHAAAYATLSKMFKQRDANCIPCHSTGYGKAGGYTGARPIGSPVDLVDVQCEACHGPGAEHSRDGRYASRAAESCKDCHTKEQDPTFNYSKAWQKIAH